MAELADAPDLGSGIFDVQVQVLSGAPKAQTIRQDGLCFSSFMQDLKDERYRATLRGSVVTASDQAPAGERVKSCQVHHTV